MNKLSSVLMLFLLTAFNSVWSRNLVEINGFQRDIDTIVYRQIGPGTMYTYMRIPNYPVNVHMLTINLNDKYNSVETFQANNRVGSTERMTKAYTRLATSGHTPIGSVNGNFWVVSGQGQPDELLGVPYSGSMNCGEMITNPDSWNRGHGAIGFAFIDENKKAWINDMGFDGKVTIDSIGDYPISEINRIRETDELVFFNHFLGAPTRTDDNGTEVFIKPVSGQKWSVNSETVCEVVRIIKNKGANAIEDGESVLSGNGKAQAFLDKLTVGKKIKVNMGVYTLADKLRPVINEMVTGNALVMKNDTLTSRNTDEAYNSQLYPRTGIGTSADGKTVYLIVIDGKSSTSVGASTATMCGILKASGASFATSMDGGGSAQMMLQGLIVNKPADGTERAVDNGWMLFSTAPADNVVSKIDFSDYKITVPARAMYKPTFLAYNQYGVMLTDSLPGVKLSCDPALGEIVDGRFVASANPQNGKLKASYNGVEVEKDITIEQSSISFRLDSAIINKKKPYSIEVNAKSESMLASIDPSLLTWEVGDPAVCSIDKGLLKGISNGKTLVIGTLGNFKDTLKVAVEIPESDVISADKIADLSTWKLNASSNITGMSLSSATFPVKIRYTYSSGRSPYIQLYKEFSLYGIPDSLQILMNTGETGALKAIVTARANNQTTYSPVEFTGIEKGKDYILNFPMAKLLTDINDRACYPVHFEGLKLMLDATSQTSGQTYEINIKEFSMTYGNLNVGITNPELMAKLRVYPNPVRNGVPYVKLNIDKPLRVSMELYSLSGKKVLSKDFGECQPGELMLPVSGVEPGAYLLNIYEGGKKDVAKLIFK